MQPINPDVKSHLEYLHRQFTARNEFSGMKLTDWGLHVIRESWRHEETRKTSEAIRDILKRNGVDIAIN